MSIFQVPFICVLSDFFAKEFLIYMGKRKLDSEEFEQDTSKKAKLDVPEAEGEEVVKKDYISELRQKELKETNSYVSKSEQEESKKANSDVSEGEVETSSNKADSISESDISTLDSHLRWMMDNLSEHSSDWTTSDTHSSQLSSSDSSSPLPSPDPDQNGAITSEPLQPAQGSTTTAGSIQPTSMGPPPNPLSPPPLTYEGDSPPGPIIKDGIGIDPSDNDAWMMD
jgi:hypothetical protein